MGRPSFLTLVLQLAMIVGCTEDQTLPTSNQSVSRAVVSTQEAADQALARALASAMSNPSVRARVRNAMRASPLTEHKLVLQDFIATPDGSYMLRAAAAASSTQLPDLKTLIESLPRLDFYVPRRQDRRNWRGSPDVAVAISLADDRGSLRLFEPSGASHEIQTASLPAGTTLLLLHPEEPKARRIGAQRAVPGDVIQDAGDGELSGEFVTRRANGRTVRHDLSSRSSGNALAPLLLVECDPETMEECEGGGGSGGSGSVDAGVTYLGYLEVVNVVDNNNPYEGNEFEFGTQLRNSSHVELDRGSLYLYGMPAEFAGFISQQLIGRELASSSPNHLYIRIEEIDSWPNPDDEFPIDQLITWNMGGDVRRAGDLRCDQPGVLTGQFYSCAGGFLWSELNFTVTW